MKCPDCSADMIEGEAAVRGTLIGFLAVGFSLQHLFLKPHGDTSGNNASRKKILPSGNVTMARHCDSCGLTILKKAQTVW